MASIARQTVTYTAPGIMPVTLCRYGASILDQALSLNGAGTIQRDAVIGRDWVVQAARGNGSLTMSLTVASCHDTAAQAEAAGEDIRLAMLLHPVGMLTIQSCYDQGLPLRVTEYVAGVDRVTVEAMSSDRWYGLRLHDLTPDEEALRDVIAAQPGTAWVAISYEITLTDPHTH